MGEIVSPSPALSNLSIGSTIQCKILHVSSEMIVATYETEEKKTYQGALLFTQCQFPLGTKFKSQLQENNPRDYHSDSFFSSTTQNRHTYFQNAPKTKEALISAVKKRQNLRLRARKVLCQHCKNVCGENGKIIREKRTKAALVINKQKFRELCVKKFTLVPKLKRLHENDIRKFNQKRLRNNDKNNINIQIFDKENCDLIHSTMAENLPLKIKILPDKKTTITKLKASNSKDNLNKKPSPPEESDISRNSSDLKKMPTQKSQELVKTDLKIKPEPANISNTRTLRRKRCAIGSMEDLWDETIFDQDAAFIKIKPKLNVLTIPSIMDNFQNAKAAKKALRKARKEAKKIAKPNKQHKHKKNKKHKKDKILDDTNSDDFFRQTAQQQQQHKNEQNNICNIDIGDVVWAKESDSLWWPAKVICAADNNLLDSAAGDDRIKSNSDYLHVELYNRDQEKLRTSSANLIKPFTEFDQRKFLMAEAERHPSFDRAVQLALREIRLTSTLSSTSETTTPTYSMTSTTIASPIHCMS